MIELPNLRIISNDTATPNQNSVAVLEVLVEASSDSDPDDLSFWWQATEQTQSSLKLKLHFEKPLYVSSHYEKDWISIEIRDPLLFTSTDNLQVEKKKRKMRREIPSQLSDAAEAV